jgi:cell division protein ZipA
MDINIRDWMIIIGVLLILAVLLDGYRRMRSDPRRVKVSLAKVPGGPAGDGDLLSSSELPNGGARVIGRGDVGWVEDEMSDDAAVSNETQADPLEPGFSALSDTSGKDQDLISGLSSGDSSDAAELPAGVEPEVVMMYVTAQDDAGFAGEDILHILLACDLRFGDMNFFHRHEEAAGRGPMQFSVANMMQPGFFDIDAMAEFQTQGLIFFLTLPGPKDMMAAFESMLETAECVASNLKGDLLDESRSVATRQTQDHIRQRIRDLERRLLTHGNR